MKSMKYAIVVAAVLVAVCLAQQQDDDADWKDFKKTHKKNYADAKEEAKRKALFAATNKKIKEHNANAKAGFTMGHNHLSDATEEEKASLLGATSSSHSGNVTESGVVIPSSRQSIASLDLRGSGCMSPIRNQANCGSCWAYSALASIEYSYCKRFGFLYNFSEQQLVDCVYSSTYNGCNGGWMPDAMLYLKGTAGSSATEAAYPYTSGSTNLGGACKASSVSPKVGMSTMGVYYVASLDHVSMANALASYGTLSVALHVADSGFYNYASGVYASTVCTKSTVNHAVNIVGYGTTLSGVRFWIMRNSWGTGWGLAGYMQIARGVNMCNIERYAYFTIFP